MKPLVTAIMVTGKSPQRLPLARASVLSFFQQTYPNCRLLVVSDCEGYAAQVLDYAALRAQAPDNMVLREHDLLRVRVVEATFEGMPLGALRNLGLSKVQGGLVIQWDDDDWYHPQRIDVQMAAYRPQHAVTLLWQTRYSFVGDAGFTLEYDKRLQGIPGTVLFSPLDGEYIATDRKHEDSHLLDEHFPRRCIVINNGPQTSPGPSLYLRFFHGNNTWDERHVMRQIRGDQHRGKRYMPSEQQTYLEQTLRNFYSYARAS